MTTVVISPAFQRRKLRLRETKSLAHSWSARGPPGSSVVKNLSANAEIQRLKFSSWVGRSPKVRNDNPLLSFCLGKPTDRGAWWATVHGLQRARLNRACTHAVPEGGGAGTGPAIWLSPCSPTVTCSHPYTPSFQGPDHLSEQMWVEHAKYQTQTETPNLGQE